MSQDNEPTASYEGLHGKSHEEIMELLARTCEYAGHVWEDMGGGMQICMVCELERDEP